MRVLPGSGEGGAGGRVSGPHVALQQVGGRGGPLQPGGETRGAEQSLLHQHHQPLRLHLLLRIPRYHLRSTYSVFSAIAKFTQHHPLLCAGYAKRSPGQSDAVPAPWHDPLQGGAGGRGGGHPAAAVTPRARVLVTC